MNPGYNVTAETAHARRTRVELLGCLSNALRASPNPASNLRAWCHYGTNYSAASYVDLSSALPAPMHLAPYLSSCVRMVPKLCGAYYVWRRTQGPVNRDLGGWHGYRCNGRGVPPKPGDREGWPVPSQVGPSFPELFNAEYKNQSSRIF
jgi:hypothetical protein